VCQNWSSCVKYTPPENSFPEWRFSSPPRRFNRNLLASNPLLQFPDAQCRQYQAFVFASACRLQDAVDPLLTTEIFHPRTFRSVARHPAGPRNRHRNVHRNSYGHCVRLWYLEKNLSLRATGTQSVMTTIFSQALSAGDSSFSRLTNFQDQKTVAIRPCNPKVRRIRPNCRCSLSLRNQKSAPPKEIPAGGTFCLGLIKESAQHTILLDSVPPDLAISNVDMQIDRSARFPTRMG